MSEDDPQLPIVGFQRPPIIISSHRLSQQSSSSNPAVENLCGLRLVRKFSFLCLLLPFSLTSTVSFVFAFNFHKSAQRFVPDVSADPAIDNALSAVVALQILLPPLVGFLSDKYADAVPRANICVLACVPFVVCSTLLVLFPDAAARLSVLTLTLSTLVFAQSCFWTLSPVLLIETYGSKYFALNFAGVLTLLGVFYCAADVSFKNDVGGSSGGDGRARFRSWMLDFDACFIFSIVLLIIFAKRQECPRVN